MRQLAAWVAQRPGSTSGFWPDLLTRTAVEGFLSELEARGHGPSHRAKAKSAISGFCVWLVEEKGLLPRNPTRGVDVPATQVLAPRRLSPDQRYVLKNLAEKEGGAERGDLRPRILGGLPGLRRLLAHRRELPRRA